MMMIGVVMVSPEILNACNTPPDYSSGFTSRVAGLKDKLEGVLGVEVGHDADMNYSASQRLIVSHDIDGLAVNLNSLKAKRQVNVFVSSRGPFFTSKVFALCWASQDDETVRLQKPGNYWREVTKIDEEPIQLRQSMIAIETLLKSFHFRYIRPKEGDHIMEGHFTELDGSPATVFDILFSEVF